MNLLRKVVILAHRYLGIALALPVVIWFASGIAMLYAREMPRLTPEMRLERLTVLDLSRVRLSPADAAERMRVGGDGLQLLMVMDRPAYRTGRSTMFADTGEMLAEIGPSAARTIASRFMRVPEDRVTFVATLTRPDQWTVGQMRALPLHKFQIADEDAPVVYVQPRTGEVATITTRRGRVLAWLGAIPHWLYFTSLRENQPLWSRVVIWLSGAGCVLATLGLILGIAQFRRTRPFRLTKAIPYTGSMRWHYVTGVVFGVFTLTWLFSGMLSMDPFPWANASGLQVRRDGLSGGPIDLSAFPARPPGDRPIKEVEFARIQDRPYYVFRPGPVLVSADTIEILKEPFTVASIVARLEKALPGIPIVEAALLDDYDWYYYSRDTQLPLPVLRVKLGDAARTWVYVDPVMSRVIRQINKGGRVERWLYNGLHSLDFPFWYQRRPLWDIAVITLLLGGLTSSGIGLFLGVKRISRL